jgi:hypothetical protein
MACGTTVDTFLRSNLDWLSKAAHWSKFSAVASQGVVHRGQLGGEAMRILSQYLPAEGAPTTAPYTEGGALYALGLIHANTGAAAAAGVAAAPGAVAAGGRAAGAGTSGVISSLSTALQTQNEVRNRDAGCRVWVWVWVGEGGVLGLFGVTSRLMNECKVQLLTETGGFSATAANIHTV